LTIDSCKMCPIPAVCLYCHCLSSSVILCCGNSLLVDPQQRLAVFRKLEEISRVYPMPMKRQAVRQDYFQGKLFQGKVKKVNWKFV